MPEEVKKVLSSWDVIRETMENPLKDFLGQCKLSINDEDTLLIVPTEIVAQMYLQKEGMMDRLREAVAESVDKDVKIELRPYQNEDEFGNNYVDVAKIFGKIVETDSTI